MGAPPARGRATTPNRGIALRFAGGLSALAAASCLCACGGTDKRSGAATAQDLTEARSLVSSVHRDVPLDELVPVPIVGPGTIMRRHYCPDEVLVVRYPRPGARLLVHEWRVDFVKKIVSPTIAYDMTKLGPDIFRSCLDGSNPRRLDQANSG